MSRRLFGMEGGSNNLPQNSFCTTCEKDFEDGQRLGRCILCHSRLHFDCARELEESCRLCRIEEELQLFEGGVEWLLALLRKVLFCIILVLCGALVLFQSNAHVSDWLYRALTMSGVAAVLVLLISASKETEA